MYVQVIFFAQGVLCTVQLIIMWKFMVLWCLSLREKFSYSEFFCSVFSRIRTEYGEIRSISPSSVRMRQNTDQINSEYAHFWRSVYYCFLSIIIDGKQVGIDNANQVPSLQKFNLVSQNVYFVRIGAHNFWATVREMSHKKGRACRIFGILHFPRRLYFYMTLATLYRRLIDVEMT